MPKRLLSKFGNIVPGAVVVLPFTGVGLTVATNVFVAVTWLRELLGLRLRKSEAAALIGPAKEQGWKLVDLVAHARKEIAAE